MQAYDQEKEQGGLHCI